MKSVEVNVKNMLQRNTSVTLGRMMNYPIVIGENEFSIQCSQDHMCSPRQNTFISDYTTMELGVDLNEINHEIKRYIQFFLSGYYVSNLGSFFMYGNIPVEELNKLIQKVYEVEKI